MYDWEGGREVWRQGDREEGKVAVRDLKRKCRKFASIPEVRELRGIGSTSTQRTTTLYISTSYCNHCFCIIFE